MSDKETNFPPPSELFYYSAAHGVLICIPCQYAVQPAAISRHLKEIHRILRSTRRPYTAYADKLELKNPEDVTPPLLPCQFPVAHLQVEQGWRCTDPGCGYMCVSTKRMETHWSGVHYRKGNIGLDWNACPLQTFFRGNMVRYFTGYGLSKHRVATSAKDTRTIPDGFSRNANSYHMTELQQKYQLTFDEEAVLEHYFASTYKSFMLKDDAFIPLWLETVPEIAANNPFLMHGMLASTALHMSHLDKDKAKSYSMQAFDHQERAIPLFRHAIKHPTEHNCNALVVYAYLLVVWSFATDLDNSSNALLLVDDQGSFGGQKLLLPQWLHFIRAGCSMLCDVWDRVEKGPVRVLAYAWDIVPEVDNKELPYLDFFLSLVSLDSTWQAESIAVYVSAATRLAESFAHLQTIRDEADFTTWHAIGVWPARVDDEFIVLLSERHPGALVLLGYFCIILKRLDGLWYFNGRSTKLLLTVLQTLAEKWHPFLEEAIQIVLGPGNGVVV